MMYPGREKARAFTFSDEDVAVLTARVAAAISQKASPPLDRLQVREKATLWAVIGAAALDSINPCDFAVMLLLIGRLLVIGRRKKVIWAGLAWSAGVYLVYFLMGYVFYTLLGVTVGTRSLRGPYILVVSSIAILMGLWQMKDLLWYGKWFSIEVPESWKPVLTRVTNSVVSIPGVFIAGMLDALFLAPCTSGPYIAILSLLSTTTTRTQGVLMLLLYNLIFILPMIGIALTVHFGITTTARAERWRTAKMGKLHFVTGVVMVLLGVGMIVGLQLGYI
jgi:cytochrome c biogenesis protein CcdA